MSDDIMPAGTGVIRCIATVPKSNYCHEHRCNWKAKKCLDGFWYCARHSPLERARRAYEKWKRETTWKKKIFKS